MSLNPIPTLYIVGALAAAGLGLFTYHKIVVSNQATEIAKLQTANETLKSNVDKAVAANASLDTEVKRIAAQSTQLVEILKTVQEKDTQTAQWFEQARASLGNSASAEEVLKKLKDNPTELVDDLNKDIDCTILNFGKLGICSKGVFVPFKQP